MKRPKSSNTHGTCHRQGAADLERLRRHPAALAILYVYAQRLICWFRIGFGRLEYDVERDKAKMSKRLQSGELFQDSPSRPEAPRSAESQQNEQTAAEGCSFSESIKNDAFCKVFASVAASISGKRANGCRVVRFFKIHRRSHQDRDAIRQDAGKTAQRAPR